MTASGDARPRLRAMSVVLFCLRFLVIASACFFVWWWKLLPGYAWVLGQTAGFFINLFIEPSIEAMEIVTNPDGILLSDTTLVYKFDDHESVFAIKDLVNSPVTYVALVLATLGLSWKRRIAILLGGLLFFYVGQAIYMTCFYLFAEELLSRRQIAYAIAQFWLTLPFVMWIVLAYWDRLGVYFQGERRAKPASDPKSRTL